MNLRFDATTCLKAGRTARNGQKGTSARVDNSSTLNRDAKVLIVGHDFSASRQLAETVKLAGFRSITFETAAELADSTHLAPPCCVLLEINSAQKRNFDLQQELARRFEFVPVIILSEDPSLQMGIAAMKAGAADYILEPAAPAAIADAIKTALAKQAKSYEFSKCSLRFQEGLRRLTFREREVLSFIIEGFLNKQIAAELGISEKTIKVHRGRVMKKMQVASFAELVRLAERASIAQNFCNENFSTRAGLKATRDPKVNPPTTHGELTPNCLL